MVRLLLDGERIPPVRSARHYQIEKGGSVQRRHAVPSLAIAGMTALLVAACASAPAATPSASFTGGAELSLPPAREHVAPPSAELPPDLPAFIPPPPSGAPPPPMTVDYSGVAADLAGFVAAYREAFAVPDLDEGAIAEAGARLCSYLERSADPSGVVHLDLALADADLFEPGYPRDAWLAGFEIADRFYCPDFVLDLPGASQ
jgi:hypothetical protein